MAEMAAKARAVWVRMRRAVALMVARGLGAEHMLLAGERREFSDGSGRWIREREMRGRERELQHKRQGAD
jgi:hypothetical protein